MDDDSFISLLIERDEGEAMSMLESIWDAVENDVENDGESKDDGGGR